MSGHSKWSTIKHKKATTDARRGKMFSKILKEITVAARIGGGDPKGNARLRSALLEARSNSVPGDNIDRAIKKGTGELEAEVYEEIVYEGYGPGGVAVMVETATDNRNRTANEVRHTFARHGGNLGEAGCVGWMFRRRGYFAIERSALPGMNEEKLMELALDLGADDVAVGDEVCEIYTAMGDFLAVQEELERRKIPTVAAELAMIPDTLVDVPRDKAGQVARLVETLEDHDDVQKVWVNADFANTDESVLAAQSR
jgi:YebC/PmpR family DNA-binding regulatory protein